ncbi:hypothetical protein PIB30_012193 [Stylosanthes scabra]|uniref:At1g61320/AtMIF1 LRR domain-containing protein n=1 Tax=Stylosanthes scabra TaxID=79078 RepID=A0ABU6U8N2_9FABA|nr:hypothetical protein [Stylosanthes scabra]
MSLTKVLFTQEGVIEHLISHCPLIEDLNIGHCYVYNHGHLVKSLFLHGLQKLKKVDLRIIQQVHIDSPNLENLSYEHLVMDAAFKLNFNHCTNLICLRLKSIVIAEKWLLKLLSNKFPFLESLELCDCSLPDERINIISAQLKVLKLYQYSNLKEVNINVPNLKSLLYEGYEKPVISFMRSSNQLQASVITGVDYWRLYSLRDFIRNIPKKILASLSLFVIRPILGDPRKIPAMQVFSNTPPVAS